MKAELALLTAVIMLFLAKPLDAQQVCRADALPTIDDVRSILGDHLTRLGVARLNKLTKIDGQRAEIFGVPVYTLYFSAEIEFTSAAFVSPFSPHTVGGGYLIYAIEKVSPFGTFNRRPGDRNEFQSEIVFERMERGWRNDKNGEAYCGWPTAARPPLPPQVAKDSSPSPSPAVAPTSARDTSAPPPSAPGARSPVPPKVSTALAAPTDPRLFYLPTKSRANTLEDFGEKVLTDERYTPELAGYATGINLAGPGYAVAAADGRVARIVDVGRKDKDFGLGNTVILEHLLESGDTLYSLYAHLAGFSSEIRMGQMLRRGTVIGPIGSSGYGREKYWLSTRASPRCVRPTLNINPTFCVRLHFELKSKPVLENPSGEKVCRAPTLLGSKSSLCYGYTPQDPTALGYVDPKTVFGRVRVKADSEPPRNQPSSALEVPGRADTGATAPPRGSLGLADLVPGGGLAGC